jgi:hypothetical protein
LVGVQVLTPKINGFCEAVLLSQIQSLMEQGKGVVGQMTQNASKDLFGFYGMTDLEQTKSELAMSLDMIRTFLE